MSTAESRDLRWLLLKDPIDIGLLRELLQGIMLRLDNLDRNGGNLTIPAGAITQDYLAANSVGADQIQANAVGSGEIAAGAVGASELATDAVTTTKIANTNVTTAKLADDAVTKAKLAGGFLKGTCLAGDVAGDHTLTGIATGDELVLVARLDRDAVAANLDLTSITGEFTITAADTINNGGGTDTTGDALLVLYLDLT